MDIEDNAANFSPNFGLFFFTKALLYVVVRYSIIDDAVYEQKKVPVWCSSISTSHL